MLWNPHSKFILLYKLNFYAYLEVVLLHVCSSGKCQIIHWRQGHKQECQQLAISRNLSLTVDSVQSRPFMQNMKQVFRNVFEEPCYSDFHSDVFNDASPTRSDMSYDSASERKLSDSEKRVPSKLKKEQLRSNDSAACAFEHTVASGADASIICGNTLFTDLSSKDTPLGNKVVSTFSWFSLCYFDSIIS